MIVKKAYNIRLYPNKGQANFINKTIGGCRNTIQSRSSIKQENQLSLVVD